MSARPFGKGSGPRRRYSIVSSHRWRTIDGDGQAAIIKERRSGRAFIVLGPPAIQALVRRALNALAASEARLQRSLR